MKRTLKVVLIAFGVFVLLAIGVVVYFRQPPDDGRTPAERRQIADACFAMLHSSLTNEVDPIKPDDPRVPEVIRALHPIAIDVTANFSVQIDGTGTPPEYFLMRLPGHTNTWVLCAAGPPIRFGPREILRIEQWPNQSPEPTWVGASVLRLSVLLRRVTVPTWLSFFR